MKSHIARSHLVVLHWVARPGHVLSRISFNLRSFLTATRKKAHSLSPHTYSRAHGYVAYAHDKNKKKQLQAFYSAQFFSHRLAFHLLLFPTYYFLSPLVLYIYRT